MKEQIEQLIPYVLTFLATTGGVTGIWNIISKARINKLMLGIVSVQKQKENIENGSLTKWKT